MQTNAYTNPFTPSLSVGRVFYSIRTPSRAITGQIEDIRFERIPLPIDHPGFTP